MKKQVCVLFLVAVVALAKAAHLISKRTTIESNPFVQKLKTTPFRLSEGLVAFNHDLFRALARVDQGNIVFSPFSLHTALSMALIGAPNATATYRQLASALKVNLEHSEDYLYNYLTALHFYDSVKANTKIKLANKAFAEQNLSIKANYLTVLELFFRSGLQRVDFANGEKAAKDINSFVSDKTNGLIRDIAKPSAFTTLTKMVLVNVIYFKGNWMHRFDVATTSPMTFNVKPGLSVQHRHGMHMKASLRRADLTEIQAQVLELPYENDAFRMLLILPDSDIRDINLDAIDYQSIDDRLQETTVMVTLPRFKIEHSVKVKAALEALGVSDLFDKSKAELDDISDDDGLYVSDVTHKAVVEVNEQGSEAAAVTSIQIDTRSGSPAGGLVRMVFDKPFYFVIQDSVHDVPLFFGRITDPNGVYSLSDNDIPEEFGQEVPHEERISLASILGLNPDCGELGFDTSTTGKSTSKVSLPCQGQDTFPIRSNTNA